MNTSVFMRLAFSVNPILQVCCILSCVTEETKRPLTFQLNCYQSFLSKILKPSCAYLQLKICL